MDRGSGAYSLFVGWAKVILPLAALALLSTLFLLARAPGEAPALPISAVRELARDQGITAPRLAGRTDAGAIVTVTARSARADTGEADRVAIDEIVLHLENPDGTTLNVAAIRGEVDGSAERARFLGLARVEASGGYEMETNDLEADLATGAIRSTSAVEIRAPFGQLTAGGLLYEDGAGAAGATMRFTRGVRLVYQPQ